MHSACQQPQDTLGIGIMDDRHTSLIIAHAPGWTAGKTATFNTHSSKLVCISTFLHHCIAQQWTVATASWQTLSIWVKVSSPLAISLPPYLHWISFVNHMTFYQLCLWGKFGLKCRALSEPPVLRKEANSTSCRDWKALCEQSQQGGLCCWCEAIQPNKQRQLSNA